MGNMNFEGEFIRKLAELLNETGLTEIELEEGDKRIRVAKQIQQAVSMAAPAYAAMPAPQAAAPAAGGSALAPVDETALGKHPGALKSPMVGTAYRASEPGAAPFVNVGDAVKQGQTVLIIEAMKVMNPIKAPKSGTITHLLVEDAQPVEYGEVLLVIE